MNLINLSPLSLGKSLIFIIYFVYLHLFLAHLILWFYLRKAYEWFLLKQKFFSILIIKLTFVYYSFIYIAYIIFLMRSWTIESYFEAVCHLNLQLHKHIYRS